MLFPGRFAFTSFQFSSAGNLPKLPGRLPAGAHWPFRSVAFSHASLFRRYSVFVGSCWNRSQLVFTAYFKSFSLIGLQIRSPPRVTITRGRVAEEKRRRTSL